MIGTEEDTRDRESVCCEYYVALDPEVEEDGDPRYICECCNKPCSVRRL